MIYEATSFECSRIAQDLQIRKLQVETVVQLFNEGNTVPFITRYRKEATAGLDEDVLRQILSRLNFVKSLNDRKQTILKSIESKGRLTEELRREILHAPTTRRLEDLYLPFKPKKKSLAPAAIEKGLEPAAFAIWHSDPAVGNLDELFASLVNPDKQLNTADDVRIGVQHILAELMNETAEVRAHVRRLLWKAGSITASRSEKVPPGIGNEFKPYFQFKESTQDIRSHRILALNRGEKEGILKVNLEWPMEGVVQTALAALSDHLLKIAGTPPQRTAPPKPAPPPSPEPSAPAPGEPPVTPTPGEPPHPAPETPPSPPPTPPEVPPGSPPSETPPAETPPSPSRPSEVPPGGPPLEVPPASPPPGLPPMAPPPGMPPPPHAAPLVELLSTESKASLTGDPLVEGSEFKTPHGVFLKACLEDALQRLMLPAMEREIRQELTDEAELHAVRVFAHNIRSLLMQPPMVGKRILAIYPGYRNGCKLAALDEQGNLLDHAVIFPHGGASGGKKWKDKEKDKKSADATASPATEGAPGAASSEQPQPEATSSATPPELSAEMGATTTPTPEVGPVEPPAAPAAEPTPPAEAAVPDKAAEAAVADKVAEAKTQLIEFAKKHNLAVIAIGNGVACRDTEAVVADAIAAGLPDASFAVVSEIGAAAYGASPLGKEELPNLDAHVRAAVSIGRRLQDPLSELVKIDVQHLGVGLYPHDLARKELRETLEGVIESCVNHIGVDVNSAATPLLRWVSGLNPMLARDIVEHRKNYGPLPSREQLQNVPGVTATRYAQAAGFLKVPGSANPLDRTWIHPESYPLAERVIAELGATPSVLDDKAAHPDFRNKLNEVNIEELAAKMQVSVAAIDDLFFRLARPGRDPRDDHPPAILKKSLLKLDDLQPAQELKGTVLNVVDFGVFVDVGLKDSGLVHISQMANKYIKSPYDVVAVNDIVTVWVLKIDKEANHVSLTMIPPRVERRPEERRPRDQRAPRREGESAGHDQRPPRGRGGPPRDQGDRRSPPQRGGSRPPRHGVAAREVKPGAAAPPPPPPPPRKPRREAPKPKLTQAAMEGKAPLRTLGELAAFFAAKEKKEEPTPAPPVEEKKELPPEAPPPAVTTEASPQEVSAGETPQG